LRDYFWEMSLVEGGKKIHAKKVFSEERLLQMCGPTEGIQTKKGVLRSIIFLEKSRMGSTHALMCLQT